MNEILSSLNQEWLRHLKQLKTKIESSCNKLKSIVKKQEFIEIKTKFFGALQVKYNDLTETYSKNFQKYYEVSSKLRDLMKEHKVTRGKNIGSLEQRVNKEFKIYQNDYAKIEESKAVLLDITNILGFDQKFLSFKEKLVSIDVDSQNKSLYLGNLKKDPTFGEKIKDGYGFLTEDDNQRIYFGGWKDDMRNGFGKQVYKNGTLFMGKWKDGLPQEGYIRIGTNIDEIYYGDIKNGYLLARVPDEGNAIGNRDKIEHRLIQINQNDYSQIEVIDPDEPPRRIQSFVKISPSIW